MRHFAELFIIMLLFAFSACAGLGDGNETEEAGGKTPKTSPVIDFDGDGIPDRTDDDDDNDGFSDLEEEEAGTDPYNTFDHPDIKEPTADKA